MKTTKVKDVQTSITALEHEFNSDGASTVLAAISAGQIKKL